MLDNRGRPGPLIGTDIATLSESFIKIISGEDIASDAWIPVEFPPYIMPIYLDVSKSNY